MLRPAPAPLAWTERLAVGVPEIDAQHRELFARVARLDRALDLGTRDELGRLLAWLREYALLHFETEERHMRDRGYARYPEHKGVHDAFVERYLALWHDFEREGTSALLTLRVQNWIGGWLEGHVAEHDFALGAFLNGRTVR